MPRELPFDAAVGSLYQLVEAMVPGEELVLTVQGNRGHRDRPSRRVGPASRDRKRTPTLGWRRL